MHSRRYSSYQSCSVADDTATLRRVSGISRHHELQPQPRSAFSRCGEHIRRRCFHEPTTFSAALQTEGRCVLALITMGSAISKSADSSTKIWQFPAPVSITGTVEFSVTKVMRPAPPRGMITSTKPAGLDQFVHRLPRSSNRAIRSRPRERPERQSYFHQPLIAAGRFFASAQYDGVAGLQRQHSGIHGTLGRDS